MWDYDMTEEQVREILRGDNKTERHWMMARILTNARYEDVWSYLRLSDLAHEFTSLRLRPEVNKAWSHAMTVWGYHV